MLHAAGILVAVGAAILFLWQAASVLLLGFGGVLLAVLLRGLSAWLHRTTRLPMGVSLAAVVVVLISLLASAIYFLSPSVGRQARELQTAVAAILPIVQERVGDWPLIEMLSSPGETSTPGTGDLPEASTPGPAGTLQPDPPASSPNGSPGFRPSAPTVRDLFTGGAAVARRIFGVFSTALGALGALLLVILLGIFFAADPETYRNGFLRLLPVRIRPRVLEVLDEIGYTLRWWMIGQACSMATLGLLVTGGLWSLGVPLAPVLGLLAAVLTFVPYLGPIISAIPGLLIAWSVSPTLLLYALLLYVVVQNLEGSVITPLVQQTAVRVPPVLIITAQMLAGIVWGVLGIVLATPLLAAGMVVMKRLYVEDVLGDSFEKAAVPDDSRGRFTR